MNFFTSNFKPQLFVSGVLVTATLIVSLSVAFNCWFYIYAPDSDLKRAQNAEKGGYEVIVVGSSRANAYVPYFEERFKTLNLAAGGAKPYEMKRRLEHALRFSAPKEIIIDLGFFSFNRYWPGSQTYTEYFFTTTFTRSDTLHRFKRFIFYSLDYRNLFTNLKQLYKPKKDHKKVQDKKKKAGSLLPNKKAFFKTEEFYMRDGYNPTPFKQYQYDADIFDTELHAILEMGYLRDIEITLITSPVHARLLNILDIMGLWSDLENWKIKLVELNERVAKEYNQQAFPIYDAMIFSPSTMIDIEMSGNLYKENSHFKPFFASKVLDSIRLRGNVQPNHYVLISSKNIDRHLEVQSKKKEKYRMQKPNIYNDLLQRNITIKRAKKYLKID